MSSQEAMPDITIETAINGYVIKRRKSGHDWINRWVADSVENLCIVITNICTEDQAKQDKEGK